MKFNYGFIPNTNLVVFVCLFSHPSNNVERYMKISSLPIYVIYHEVSTLNSGLKKRMRS